MPAPACVEEALLKVSGVTEVTHATTELNGQPLHRFTYRAEGVAISVDIERGTARPEYIHAYEVFNTVPPEALVARLRPVMARVDAALESRCGMRGLSRSAEEHCPRGPFRSTLCPP